MTKPNFSKIFSYDTATESNCRETITTYRNIAQTSFEQAGESLLMIAQRNPTTVELEWFFTPKEDCKKF